MRFDEHGVYNGDDGKKEDLNENDEETGDDEIRNGEESEEDERDKIEEEEDTCGCVEEDEPVARSYFELTNGRTHVLSG